MIQSHSDPQWNLRGKVETNHKGLLGMIKCFPRAESNVSDQILDLKIGFDPSKHFTTPIREMTSVGSQK